MIPKECKRLAEVDFPIAVVSKHSAREKSIRHGHPSTLHLWWARRPLAACRAMLLVLLLPDPCDPFWPEDFKSKTCTLLPEVTGAIGPKESDLRKALLKFIGDVSNWDFSSNQTYLEVGRSLVKAAHPEETIGAAPKIRGQGGKRKKRAAGEVSDEALRARREATTLDRVHAAMLLQASGRANALRTLLKGEQDRGPDFLRLANAFSVLYPKDSEEKTVLDAMLLAMPR